MGSLKIGAVLRNAAVIFYVLYNDFFYVLLSFVFHLQKGFYGVHDKADAFFLFLLQKDFDTFHELLFETFLCFSDSNRQLFLYMWKKCLINFSYTQNYLHSFEITLIILRWLAWLIWNWFLRTNFFIIWWY